MALTLTSEQEAKVLEIAGWRGFESAEGFLEQTLIEPHGQESYIHEHRSEFSAMMEEAQRGELRTPRKPGSRLLR